MATPESPQPIDADLLDAVIEGRLSLPSGEAVEALLATASLMGRLTPVGPSIETRVAMVERFSLFVDRRRSPGFLGWLGLGYAGRRMAGRLAAGALLISVASGGTYAITGVSPADIAESVVDLGGNLVTNLNPGRKPGNDSEAGIEPTASPTPEVTAATTPAGQTPLESETPPNVTPSAPTQPAGSENQTFSALGAGTVTLRRTGSSLEVVSTAPNDGWSVEVDRPSGPDVEVSFTSGDVEVRFEAAVVGGQIVPDVEQREADGGGADDDGSGNSEPDGGDDDSTGSSGEGGD